MIMDSQFILNVLFGLISFLAGWIINVLWAALKDLQQADKELSDKVAQIEVLVAGDYIKKSDFERFSDAVWTELMKNSTKRKIRNEKTTDYITDYFFDWLPGFKATGGAGL